MHGNDKVYWALRRAQLTVEKFSTPDLNFTARGQ